MQTNHEHLAARFGVVMLTVRHTVADLPMDARRYLWARGLRKSRKVHAQRRKPSALLYPALYT